MWVEFFWFVKRSPFTYSSVWMGIARPLLLEPRNSKLRLRVFS